MNIKETVISMRVENPTAPISEISIKLGVSKQYVHQILKKAGLPTRTSFPRCQRPPDHRLGHKQHFGKVVSPTTTGSYCELVVCADLLSRGFDVFRSVSGNARCDLIAASRVTQRMLRIEVRSGKRQVNGTLIFARTTAEMVNHDIVAVVVPGDPVAYVSGTVGADALATLDDDSDSMPKKDTGT